MSAPLVIVILLVGGALVLLVPLLGAPKPAKPAPKRRSSSESAPRNAVDRTLFEAAKRGDPAEVRRLVEEGGDPKLRNESWVSPLGIAVIQGHDQTVRELLELGADPNAPADEDSPALFVAATHLRASLVEPLVRAGACLDFTEPTVGTALAMAVAKGDHPSAEALLQAGVAVDLRSQGGARAIHMAALTGRRDLLDLLMAHGADVHCPNFQGGTPLRSAAHGGHHEIVKLLLGAGADPSPLDDFGKRPIDYAKEAGHSRVVAMLNDARPVTAVERACATEVPLSQMLPAREDATLKSVIHAQEQGLTMQGAAASALEAPSMITAVRAIAGRSFEVEFSVTGAPDPRLPVRSVKRVLWSYERSGELSCRARAAVSEPSPTVRERVAAVAEYPYLLDAWSVASAKAASELGVGALDEIFAAMIHPLPGPAYLSPWDWYFRNQVAAALILSHLGQEPWAESERRSALEDILDGPADWCISAACIALLDVGRRDAAARPLVIEALLRTARRAVCPPIYQHAIRPAALALLELPDLDPGVSSEVLGLITSGS